MASQSKIYFLKDRKDYVKKLTNDKIINPTPVHKSTIPTVLFIVTTFSTNPCFGFLEL